MTMQNPTHPPEERLAALADGDPDVLADDGLRTHVAACASCTDLVADLRALRVALADLPDLAPSRTLQLVPPAPAAPERRGWLGTLRGLAAPLMTAGAALALVGAVGLGGVATTDLSGAGAAAPEMAAGSAAASAAASSGRGAADAATSEPNSYRPGSAQPAASVAPQGDETKEGAVETLTDTSTSLPWVLLLVGGGALLATGLALRFAINPRAG